MSEVLRKKILCATGVPQSVLRMQAFWEQLRTAFGAWSLEAFGVEMRPVFETRRVISGKAALELLSDTVSFKFPSDGGSGLAAIMLDTSCVNQYASKRLNEPAESIGSSSKLLLKLVCEELAVALRKGVSASFEKLYESTVPGPTESILTVAGQFGSTTRYLLITARIQLQPEPISVSLVFLLDHLQQYAREMDTAAADRAARAQRQTPDALRLSVRKSSVSIDAVLDRLPMSIGECSRLSVGQILPLPGAALDRLSISAETVSGDMNIGRGEMGVLKHNRAVKLESAILPGFVRNIAEL